MLVGLIHGFVHRRAGCGRFRLTGVVEGHQQLAQQDSELVAFGGAECFDEDVLVGEVVGRTASSSAAIPAGVSATSRPRPSLGSRIRSMRPSAASRSRRWVIAPDCHQQRVVEAGGRQHVRLARPPQGSEDIETPTLQVVTGEHRLDASLQEPEHPGDASEHSHRARVVTRRLPEPLFEDVVE